MVRVEKGEEECWLAEKKPANYFFSVFCFDGSPINLKHDINLRFVVPWLLFYISIYTQLKLVKIEIILRSLSSLFKINIFQKVKMKY